MGGQGSGGNKPWLWKKGQTGNPNGRSVDAMRELKSLQAYAKSITNNGQACIDVILNVMQTAPSPQTQLVAAQLLLDRMHGKAKESTETVVTGTVAHVPVTQSTINLRGLDQAALIAIREALSRQIAEPEPDSRPESPDVIDVTSVEK